MAGVEPVEESRSRSPNMEKAGWRRREAGNDVALLDRGAHDLMCCMLIDSALLLIHVHLSLSTAILAATHLLKQIKGAKTLIVQIGSSNMLTL